jgi:hypothetical protein
MCDFSGKLVAWLDQEVPSDEAAHVERHLKDCSACRSEVDAYKRVSVELDAYCDAATAAGARPAASRWVLVASGTAAAAALVALFLAMPRAQVKPPAFHSLQATVAAPPAMGDKADPASVKSIQRNHRRQAIAPASIRNASSALVQTQNDYMLADEPVIQIAIPADEMFPPGAVPEGMHFVADVTIGADGSAEGLRLHPRLTGFERRTTEP